MAASGELLCISYHKQQRQTPLRAPFPQVLLGFSFMKVSGKHFCKAAEQNHSDLPALFFFFFFHYMKIFLKYNPLFSIPLQFKQKKKPVLVPKSTASF